ncbi:MAG: hypothetical protein RLZZ568_743 [Cyanobacteriota bacterium]|jgi:hypothetical protein
MTPTLFGRWQTRLFLLATVGALITWLFADGIVGRHPSSDYWWVLVYVGVLGMVWDVLYHFLMQLFWDHDWPGILQFAAAIVEGVFLGGLFYFVGLPPYVPPSHFSPFFFVTHYSLVWISIYCFSWTGMRLLFPHWRYRGGEWIGPWPKA